MAGKGDPNLRSLRERESIPHGTVEVGFFHPNEPDPSVHKVRGQCIFDLRGSSLGDGDLTKSEDSSRIAQWMSRIAQLIGGSLRRAVDAWCRSHGKTRISEINTLFPGWEVLGLEYSVEPVGEALEALAALRGILPGIGRLPQEVEHLVYLPEEEVTSRLEKLHWQAVGASKETIWTSEELANNKSGTIKILLSNKYDNIQFLSGPIGPATSISPAIHVDPQQENEKQTTGGLDELETPRLERGLPAPLLALKADIADHKRGIEVEQGEDVRARQAQGPKQEQETTGLEGATITPPSRLGPVLKACADFEHQIDELHDKMAGDFQEYLGTLEGRSFGVEGNQEVGRAIQRVLNKLWRRVECLKDGRASLLRATSTGSWQFQHDRGGHGGDTGLAMPRLRLAPKKTEKDTSDDADAEKPA